MYLETVCVAHASRFVLFLRVSFFTLGCSIPGQNNPFALLDDLAAEPSFATNSKRRIIQSL